MKKVVFAIVLFTVMISCNDSNTSTSTPVDSTSTPVDTSLIIPVDTITNGIDTLKAL